VASPNPLVAFPLLSLVGTPAREAARAIAEQARLAEQFAQDALPPETAAASRLQLLPSPRFAGLDEDLDGLSLGWERAQSESEGEDEDGKGESSTNSRRVVLKVDSHITLHTVLDALDDAADEETVPTSSSPAEVIRHGAGDVTPTDLLVAREAGAEVVTFKVKVLSGAPKGSPAVAARKSKTRVRNFTRVQDVVQYILGRTEK